MGKIFDFGFMMESVPKIASKLPVTLYIAFLSGLIAIIIGFVVAMIRYFHVRVLSQIAQIYVSCMRGTPAMVQLLVAYYGIPILLRGINASLGTSISVNGIPAAAFAVFALSMNSGAFMSETIRGAMLAVDAGQLEACYSVNMSTWQAMRRIILPQAFTNALPALGNSFISLLKDTSLIFNISVIEMMAQAKITGSKAYRFFEVYIVVALIYWGVCFLMERGMAVLERHIRRYERSAVK